MACLGWKTGRVEQAPGTSGSASLHESFVDIQGSTWGKVGKFFECLTFLQMTAGCQRE